MASFVPPSGRDETLFSLNVSPGPRAEIYTHVNIQKLIPVHHLTPPAKRPGCNPSATCQPPKKGILSRMSITAEKVAEVLALPEQDRAYLARQLITSLDDPADADAEAQWNEVIDRRSREIEAGKVTCRPVEETVRDIRARLHARRQPS